MQDQVKSDINAMNLRLTDIEENMAPQVNDLQHRIEACALDVQSICENIPAHFIEDSELWFRKLEDLDKKMQLNLSNLSKTTTLICNLQGKVDMNSVLVQQLFQERSKSAKSPVEDVIKPRPRSRRRRAVSQDSRASSLDVIAENACQSASLEANVTSTSALNSAHGSCKSSHLDELRGGCTNSRVTEPLSRSKTHLQLHEFSLSGSSAPSRIPTLFSSLSTKSQFKGHTKAPSKARLVPASPGVFRTAAHGSSPVRFTKLRPLAPANLSECTVTAPVVTTAQESLDSPKKEVSQPLCLSVPDHTTTTTPEKDTKE